MPDYGMTFALQEGDTFAASYMKMFSTQTSIVTHIEATSDAVCILITIPEEYKEEFRTCTRPLWYEELAQYFHMSINEAAESLGMCMSAIKKICRRHGISRWPHRKLASVNKTVAMLQVQPCQELWLFCRFEKAHAHAARDCRLARRRFADQAS